MEPTSDDAGLYARSFADVYDDWYGDLDDPALLVAAFTERLAPSATIAEFGGGTGRLATPLQQAGFSVISLDVSTAMLSIASDTIASATADIAHVPLRDASVDAVLIAYNTLFNLADLDLQQRCITDAARALRPGGLLVVECFVAPDDNLNDHPDAGRAEVGFGISVKAHPTKPGAQLAILTGPEVGGESPVIVGSHIELLGDRTICRPWRLVYQSPLELDRCAQLTDLVFEARYADWSANSFDSESERHVSWYRRSSVVD